MSYPFSCKISLNLGLKNGIPSNITYISRFRETLPETALIMLGEAQNRHYDVLFLFKVSDLSGSTAFLAVLQIR